VDLSLLDEFFSVGMHDFLETLLGDFSLISILESLAILNSLENETKMYKSLKEFL
jgi:hypothetical protein